MNMLVSPAYPITVFLADTQTDDTDGILPILCVYMCHYMHRRRQGKIVTEFYYSCGYDLIVSANNNIKGNILSKDKLACLTFNTCIFAHTKRFTL